MSAPTSRGRTTQGDLTSGDVAALVRQLAVPASVGFFFSTMYNVVDTFFAGLIATEAVAALALSFPLYFLIMSLAGGLSAGGTALMGTALGRRDEREAANFALQGLVFGVLAGVVVTLGGLAAAPHLFRLLGAGEQALALSLEYMNVVFAGSVFFILVYLFNAVLVARGDTRSFRNFLILGFVLNCILDPWFVFGGLGVPPLGVGGIALATVLIQVIGTLYMGRRAWATGLLRPHSLRDFLPRRAAFAELARQGLPSSFNYFTIGLGIFVITYYIGRFGTEAVAAYGIGTRVIQITLLPSIGLSTATLALTAQNAGAGLFGRVRQARNTALRYGAWVSAPGMLLVLPYAAVFMAAFTADPEVVSVGAGYLRVEALALYGYVVLAVSVSTMQGLKRPMFGVWLGLFRQVAAPVVVFTLLLDGLGTGLPGIWWGICGIVLGSAAFALCYTGCRLREAEGGRKTAG